MSLLATAAVAIQFAAFAPSQVDVLPGDTVRWQNMSERTHTVTADDGSFGSGDLFGDAAFEQRFDAVGAHAYHCTIHPSMVGEVDVRRVTLNPLPPAAVPQGQRVTFSGRTAQPGAPVRIERGGPDHVSTVATVTPAPDGTWSVSLVARSTGDFLAAAGGDVSETRRLLVQDRTVIVRATGRGVAVHVTPPLPYGRLLVQEVRRERFGWWPVARRRLDYRSRARVPTLRPGRVRVLVVDRDGWTPLAISRAVRVRRTAR